MRAIWMWRSWKSTAHRERSFASDGRLEAFPDEGGEAADGFEAYALVECDRVFVGGCHGEAGRGAAHLAEGQQRLTQQFVADACAAD